MAKETVNQNNNILYAIIIVLVIIVALLGGYLIGSQKSAQDSSSPIISGTTPTNTTGEGITVTIIDDKRCASCGTSEITSQIKQVPFLAKAEFIEKDFSDEGVEAYVKENQISALPAVIFSTNVLGDGGTMAPYLSALSGGEYSLQVGSTFDPFEERSEKGFLLLDKQILSGITSGGYVKGNPNSKIVWIEYSDLECPFCAKLHNASTIDDVFEKYSDNISMIFQHYPLDFHANAKPGAQILECVGKENGGEAFYSLIESSFKDQNSTKSFLLDEAEKLGVNVEAIESCLDQGTFSQKVDTQMQTGQNVF